MQTFYQMDSTNKIVIWNKTQNVWLAKINLKVMANADHFDHSFGSNVSTNHFPLQSMNESFSSRSLPFSFQAGKLKFLALAWSG